MSSIYNLAYQTASRSNEPKRKQPVVPNLPIHGPVQKKASAVCHTCMLQFNPDVNHPELNAARIISEITRLRAENPSIKLFILPETVTGGHNARDNNENPVFIKQIERADAQIIQAAAALGVAILFGTTVFNEDQETLNSGKLVRNTMKFAVPQQAGIDIEFNDGQSHPNIKTTHVYNTKTQCNQAVTVYEQYKIHLPTYNYQEQNERAYYEPGKVEDMLPISIYGKRWALHLCEDGWDPKDTMDESEVLYPVDTYRRAVEELRAEGIINLSASPNLIRKVPFSVRNNFGSAANYYGVSYLWANLTGWESPLMYAGQTSFFVPDPNQPREAKPIDPVFVMKPQQQDAVAFNLNYKINDAVNGQLALGTAPAQSLIDAQSRAALIKDRIDKQGGKSHDLRMKEIEDAFRLFLIDYAKKYGFIDRDDLHFDNRINEVTSYAEVFRKVFWRAKRHIRREQPRGIVFQLRATQPVNSINSESIGAVVLAKMLNEVFPNKHLVMFCDQPISNEMKTFFKSMNIEINAPKPGEQGQSISIFEWAKRRRQYLTMSTETLTDLLNCSTSIPADIHLFNSVSKTNLTDLIEYWIQTNKLVIPQSMAAIHNESEGNFFSLSARQRERKLDKLRKSFQVYGRNYAGAMGEGGMYNQFVRITSLKDRAQFILDYPDPLSPERQQLKAQEDDFIKVFQKQAYIFNHSMDETSYASLNGVMIGRREPFRTRHLKEKTANIPNMVAQSFDLALREAEYQFKCNTPLTPEWQEKQKITAYKRMLKALYHGFTGIEIQKRAAFASFDEPVLGEADLILSFIHYANTVDLSAFVTTINSEADSQVKFNDDAFADNVRRYLANAPVNLAVGIDLAQDTDRLVWRAFKELFTLAPHFIPALPKGNHPYIPTGGPFVDLTEPLLQPNNDPVKTHIVQMDIQSGNPMLNVKRMMLKLQVLSQLPDKPHLVVFPESAIPGDNVRDDMALSARANPEFIQACDNAWRILCAEADRLGIAVIAGTIRKNEVRTRLVGGKPLVKCIRMFVPDAVTGITTVDNRRFKEYCQDKLEPRNSRTEFDFQHFEAGQLTQVLPLNIGGTISMIGIGEDAFSIAGDYNDHYHEYPKSFYEHAKRHQVTQVINPSSYPYTAGTFVTQVLPSLTLAATDHQMKVVHVTPVGWQENKMYGGNSVVVDQMAGGQYGAVHVLKLGEEDASDIRVKPVSKSDKSVADLTEEKIKMLQATIQGMSKKLGVVAWPELAEVNMIVAQDAVKNDALKTGYKGIVLNLPPALFFRTSDINSTNVGLFVLAKLIRDALPNVPITLLYSRSMSPKVRRYFESMNITLVRKSNELLTYARQNRLLAIDHTDLTDLTEGMAPMASNIQLFSSFTKSEIWAMAKKIIPNPENRVQRQVPTPSLAYWWIEENRRRYHDQIIALLFRHKRNFLVVAQEAFRDYSHGSWFDPNQLRLGWSLWPNKTRRFFGTLERIATRVEKASKNWVAYPGLGQTILGVSHPNRHASPGVNDNFSRTRHLVFSSLTTPVSHRHQQVATYSPHGNLLSELKRSNWRQQAIRRPVVRQVPNEHVVYV